MSTRCWSIFRLCLALCLVLGCRGPAAEVLGTYRGGVLTVADLDAYVRALPEARRITPDDVSPETWFEAQVRALALERVLEHSDAVRERLTSSETTANRRWAIAASLTTAVMQELAEGQPPDADAVQERMRKIAASRPSPLYNFRHVFLRLDGVGDGAEERAVRQLAASIERRARQGEDFAELARGHSQSSNAAVGGLVENQRPAQLEKAARQAIEGLAEGEVSGVVESRTGLHIFRLERKLTPEPPSQAQREQQVRGILAHEARVAARASLVAELRQRFEVATDDFPWRVGSFEVSRTDLAWMAGAGSTEKPSERVVDQLLLAEEGRRRGLRTAELEARVDRQLRREAIQAAYRQRRAAHVAAIPPERLRPIYDARPAAFAESQTAHLDLIFVPQGRDVFATQRQVEHHVAELRAGAPFAELARRISVGPGAEEDGDLGPLPPSEWARLGPEIHKTVAAMEPGAIAGPVYQTERLLTSDPRTLRGGFAILRLRARNPPRERTFEEAADALRATWARQNAAELDRQVKAGILAEAGFEIVRLPAPDEFLR